MAGHHKFALGIDNLRHFAGNWRPVHMHIEDVQENADARLARCPGRERLLPCRQPAQTITSPAGGTRSGSRKKYRQNAARIYSGTPAHGVRK